MTLLERESVLIPLRAALASEAGQVALLSGEAGIGKSSVLRALAAGHAAAGGCVLWGGCDPLETPPALGPLHDIVRDAPAPLRVGLAAALDGPRSALFDAVLDILSRPPPLLLVLEDLHWADEATLDLLKFLGRRVTRTPALLACSYRDDELHTGHPLRRVLGELPAAAVLRLPLRRLSPAAVATLAACSDRGADAAKTAHALTQGNPFFVTEWLRAETGFAVPATVQDLVLARLARLAPPVRELVQWVSLMPTRAERWLVQSLAGPEPATIEAALASGLLQADEAHWRFRHELARQAVEAALAQPLAAAMHALVLAALEASDALEPGATLVGSTSAARLAHHAVRSGEVAAISRLVPIAIDEAAARGAKREAALLARTVLRLGRPADDEQYRRWLSAHLLQGWSIDVDAGELMHSCRELERLARARGDVEDTAIHLARQASLLVGALQHPQAHEVLAQALALVAPLAPSAAQRHVWHGKAWLCMLERDTVECMAWAERTLAQARRMGDAHDVRRARSARATAQLFVDYPAARAELRALFEEYCANQEWAPACVELSNLGSGGGELMQLHDAEHALRELLAMVNRLEFDQYRDYGMAWLALVRTARGDWNEAGRLAEAVLRTEDVSAMSRLMAWVALARVRLRRGDPGVAEALAAAEALATPSATLQRQAPVAAVHAEAAMQRGDPAAAAHVAAPALALAQAKGHAWFIGELGYWAWQAGVIDAPPVHAAEPWALEIAGRWREAAAAWEVIDAPYDRARALAAGDTAAQREALTLFDRLGALPAAEALRRQLRESGARGVARGARPATRAHPAGLTGAEQRTLALMAQGLRNAEIAAHIHRSVRTVDHHVAAVLAKLGVDTRKAAVEHARREGWLAPQAHATRR